MYSIQVKFNFYSFRYYHFGVEKEDPIPKCDSCRDGNIGIRTGNSVADEEIRHNENISNKVSRISLEEADKSETPWCTKCKNSILKLEDTMPGISNIVPTFNLNKVVGRVW